MEMKNRKPEGFTLIELLIVIAIILILIAIALPNFLEAQERARVVRANGHLRTMETAVLSFYTQYGNVFIATCFAGLFLLATAALSRR